jgi:hypothetical protein
MAGPRGMQFPCVNVTHVVGKYSDGTTVAANIATRKRKKKQQQQQQQTTE